MSHWDFGRAAAGQHDDLEPSLSGTDQDDGADQDDGTDHDDEAGWDDDPGPYPVTYERDPYITAAPPAEAPRRDGSQAPPLFFAGEPGPPGLDAEDCAPPDAEELTGADGLMLNSSPS